MLVFRHACVVLFVFSIFRGFFLIPDTQFVRKDSSLYVFTHGKGFYAEDVSVKEWKKKILSKLARKIFRASGPRPRPSFRPIPFQSSILQDELSNF